MLSSPSILKKVFLFALVFHSIAISAQQNLSLWYKQPARSWNEALPIGNGRLGAMVFGNATEELIQLNEETLWSGGPVNTDPNPQAPQYLDEIRQALFNHEYQKAEA